jgi:glycosyltransferase involved in cell wall biosynthesis
LAVSSSLRELYIRLRLSPAEKVRLIGLGSARGVDTKHFLPSSATIDPLPIADSLQRPGRLVIGFVGRLSLDKGAQIILDCRRNLVRKGIDHDFLVVGSKDEIGINLLRQIAETGRHPIFVESVKDVAPYYRVMDILLLPTYREGFPNVVLEASSCSVAVVTTQATGARDSIVDGKSGILVPVGDSIGFCQAVVDLAKNQDLRIRMGTFARGWVQRNFENEKVESAHADFLERVSGQDPSLSNLQPKE